MVKILLVCLGNICRSPLAEGILKHKLKERKIQAEVDSAGTSSWHEGENPDRRAIAKAKEYGIDICNLMAREFQTPDFDKFDRIYVMDSSNFRDVLRMAKTEEHRKKVKLFLDEIFPGKNVSVPDPYYGGEEGFEKVYRLLESASEKIANDLKKMND